MISDTHRSLFSSFLYRESWYEDTCSLPFIRQKFVRQTFVRPTLVSRKFVRLRHLLFAALSFTTNIIISRDAQRGLLGRCSSPGKIFSEKISNGGPR
jgi:hypothetical protein